MRGKLRSLFAFDRKIAGVNCAALIGKRSKLAICAAAMLVLGAAQAELPAPEMDDSVISLRRLSQDQYRQSIADVFGEDIKISGRLEPDPRREGLIAIGLADASISAAGFEQYDTAAREIATQVTDPAHRGDLIGCQPRAENASDDACAKEFGARVGRFLYRRPLETDELRRFVDLARTSAVTKNDFYEGLSIALTSMLDSVPFLFRVERASLFEGQYILDDYSMASRLSFLIWNAPPDDTLLTAAGRGDLSRDEGLRNQVERMLASPHFERGVRAFFTDMLELDDLIGLQKDPAIYPRFSNKLASDAREQTLLTIVDMLVRKNEDYRELFTTRNTFMSRSLGLLYSEPVTTPTGFEPHQFPEDDPRVGILAQPAFLMAHSHPGRSSPTLRGKAVRELLMCQKVPAPPPNVDFALVQNVKDPRFATARQRIAAHNTEPMCAACHKIMDPLGLPLENFDGSAVMRDQENGVHLDLTGELNGADFTAASGLGQSLAEDPAVSSCLITRLYSYGSGHSPTEQAAEWLEGVRTEHDEQGYLIRNLIRSIVLDHRFYNLTPEPEGQGNPDSHSIARNSKTETRNGS